MKRLLPHLAFSLILATLLASTPPSARAATRTVTNAGDAGAGTLRQALTDAAAGDTIIFDPARFPPAAPPTIFIRSPLPALSKNNLTIDASNAGVILDGSQAPGGTPGLVVQATGCVIRGLTIKNFGGNGVFIGAGASGNTVGGDRGVGSGPNRQGNLIVANGGNGIEIQGAGADNNTIRGNFIGIEATGSFAQGNALNGIAIWRGARGNIVGGTAGGLRNLISGNTQNGVWIGEAGTSANKVIGNYIGTTAGGQGPVDNHLSGVAIQAGAQGNFVGDGTAGAGNLISGNRDNGIYISDAGTTGNQVLGNIIGPNAQGNVVVGHLLHGIVITLGASSNVIGNGTTAGRNLISANAYDGVLIEGPSTASNRVQGNYVGTTANGAAALSNRLHGVEITDGAHDNLIGGSAAGQGNLLSGNLNHGLVIHFDAHHNTARGNLIGPNATGTVSLGNQPFGGIDIAEGAHDNVIGGLGPGEGNVISGNQTDAIALFDNTGKGANDNRILGNRIGLAPSGETALPNLGNGISVIFGARRTLVQGNTVAYNTGYGIWVAPCTGISTGNTITTTAIYSNTLGGILTSCPVAPPTVAVAALGATETVTGTAAANTRVDIFSDDDGQGRVYEGSAPVRADGTFSFSKAGGFAGPNITATTINAAGDRSAFSEPAHLGWTVLLYLNGDSDLSQAMSGAFNTLVKAGASPRANVLALIDGKATGDTAFYDLTRSQPTRLSGPGYERNMGDGKTLVDFVSWARARYKTRYTMLSIVDHGGGWAPSTGEPVTNTLAYRSRWGAGGSGLSWDFSNNYDYMNSQEIRAAIGQITSSGAKKLDVVFYDVCLMGLVEVAYQIKDYADYFVSSQNIGWAPDGPSGRYKLVVQGIGRATTPRQMAQLLVDSYAQAIPSNEHPYTISAVDLSALPPLTTALSGLSSAISTTLQANPARANTLKAAYLDAQKFDYDADLKIEPATDGFVDISDFANRVAQRFNGNAPVLAAATTVATRLATAVVAERHLGGKPWPFPSTTWSFTGTHGLSIFLPLGEDLEYVVTQTQALAAAPITRTVHLRDLYTSSELTFVRDTTWKGMIDRYFQSIAAQLPQHQPGRPLGGLLTADASSPTSRIAISKPELNIGQSITVTWTITDTQLDTAGNVIAGSGVVSATLWYRVPGIDWTPILASTRLGTSGTFQFTPPARCGFALAVRAIDKAGNLEPAEHGVNRATIFVRPCFQAYMPYTS